MISWRQKIWVKIVTLTLVGVFWLSQLAWAGEPSLKQISCLYQAITSLILPIAHAEEVDLYKNENNYLLPLLNLNSEWKSPSDTVVDIVSLAEGQVTLEGQGQLGPIQFDGKATLDETALVLEGEVTVKDEDKRGYVLEGKVTIKNEGGTDYVLEGEVTVKDGAQIDGSEQTEQDKTKILITINRGELSFSINNINGEKQAGSFGSVLLSGQDLYQELRSLLISSDTSAKKERETTEATKTNGLQGINFNENQKAASYTRFIIKSLLASVNTLAQLTSFSALAQAKQETIEPAPIQEDAQIKKPKGSGLSIENIQMLELEAYEAAPTLEAEQFEPSAIATNEKNGLNNETAQEEAEEQKGEASGSSVAKELKEPEQTEEPAKPRKQDKTLISLSGAKFLIPPLENMTIPLSQTQAANQVNNAPKIKDNFQEANFATLARGKDNVLQGSYVGESPSKRIEEIYTANPVRGPPQRDNSKSLPQATALPTQGSGNSAFCHPVGLTGITPSYQQSGIIPQEAAFLPHNIDLALIHNHGPPL